MNAPLVMDWTSANQMLLVAEFARLRALLGDGALDTAQGQVRDMARQMPAPPAADTLATLFGLSGFERDVLLLAAGVEMDARLAALCMQAGGDGQRPGATFALALAALPDAHWSAIAPVHPLRRFRLVTLEDNAGVTGGRIRLDERVLHFMAGLNYLDHRLAALLTVLPPAGLMAQAHRATADHATERLRAHGGRLPPVLLHGNDCEGQCDVAATLAQSLGVTLYRLRASDIPAAPHEQAALASLWQREAALLGSGLLVTLGDDASTATLARFVAQIDGLLIVAGASVPEVDRESLRWHVGKVDAPGQRALWHMALGDKAQSLQAGLGLLASQYRLDARRVAHCAAQVDGNDAPGDLARLHRLCRGSGSAMGALAVAIEPRARWDDLVLPEAQRRTLQQIVVHTRHRITVHHDWGFADKGERGLGIATLFSGESGTGKTLAAEVLAHTLGLALYRIDLSAVVSKYIGETEKNLRSVFDAAEDIGAMLLFDEADALFGKRSEVKDSHDRYANIEVSYLLQRMEAYRGLAILTTNNKAALDAAFSRRLRFIVQFPFPDATQREAIWRSVFPSSTPLGDVDFAKLARLNATGGNIRNIALSAAFLAAEMGTPVGMAQLLRATHIESAKRDKAPSDAETRGWT